MYAELSYFGGYHFQHIADWQEARRLERIRLEHNRLAGRRQRISACIG
jgi:hypothetical protein